MSAEHPKDNLVLKSTSILTLCHSPNKGLISKLRLPMSQREDRAETLTYDASAGDAYSVASTGDASSHTDSLVLYGLIEKKRVAPVWKRKLIKENKSDEEDSKNEDLSSSGQPHISSPPRSPRQRTCLSDDSFRAYGIV